jgi:hypothetical protein
MEGRLCLSRERFQGGLKPAAVAPDNFGIPAITGAARRSGLVSVEKRSGALQPLASG